MNPSIVVATLSDGKTVPTGLAAATELVLSCSRLWGLTAARAWALPLPAVAYLMSLGTNTSLPRSFRNEIQEGIVAYQKTNDLPYEMLEKRMMKLAKTDEEREFVRMCMEEAKKDEED